MAGLYSELGCSQNWVSTEGIRKACQYFQVSFFLFLFFYMSHSHTHMLYIYRMQLGV